MSEINCGTCSYYARFGAMRFGDCGWPKSRLPKSITPFSAKVMRPSEGENCYQHVPKDQPNAG